MVWFKSQSGPTLMMWPCKWERAEQGLKVSEVYIWLPFLHQPLDTELREGCVYALHNLSVASLSLSKGERLHNYLLLFPCAF